ncbi:MAG: hypothetical protein ACXVY8_05290 [Gaiellaceae bacterium]
MTRIGTASYVARRSTLAVLLALAVVGAASAATSGRYQGKTKQGVKLSFRATPTSVVGFNTSVSALCVSAVSGRSVLEIYPVLRQPAGRIAANGSFQLHFKGQSSTFIDISGRLRGSSASGRLDVRYTKTLGTTSSGLLDIGACSTHTIWTARRS